MARDQGYSRYDDARDARSSFARDEDDQIISTRDKSEFAQDAFKNTADALSKAEIGKTKKLFGVFEMDAGVVDAVNGFYNLGADWASHHLRPRVFKIVETIAPRFGLSPQMAKSAAAIATVGSTAVVKAGGYFGPITESFSKQFKDKHAIIRKIAPVLDDIKGNHSLAALHLVGMRDNEVIYSHRKRMDRIADTQNLSNFVYLGINSGASLAFDAKGFYNIWQERQTLNAAQVNSILGAKRAKKSNKGEDLAEMFAGDDTDASHNLGQQVKLGVIGLVPTLAERFVATGEHKLHKELQPYSALEMIVELAEQLGSNPKARAYAAPRSFQAPKSRPQEFPLEEYLMRICIQHQKDMADINPEYTEIREALREDLAAAIKPLADGIRKGDVSPLSLIRLVGEGKIIKKQGRAIATREEIAELVHREAPKQTSYLNLDPNEYYKDATFSREQLKHALKSLEGEEKWRFAAMFPDTVLHEAGMDKKDIKAMRDATAKHYDHMLMDALVGLNAKSDQQLQTDGLAGHEIEQVRKAVQLLKHKGEEGLHGLKTSPVNDHGIEGLVANVVVRDPFYLGKLIEKGEQKLHSATNDNHHAANDRAQHHSHAEREYSRRTGTDDLELV